MSIVHQLLHSNLVHIKKAFEYDFKLLYESVCLLPKVALLSRSSCLVDPGSFSLWYSFYL